MYYVVTFCHSSKFEMILPHWMNRVSSVCKDSKIVVSRKDDCKNINYGIYAWWDVMRLTKVIELLRQGETVVHCDLDIIIQKDIKQLIDINSDIIISKEIGGDRAFPCNCSDRLGFGVCTGFYIAKPTALPYLRRILERMVEIKYDKCYSDQVAIMNSIVDNGFLSGTENITLDGLAYKNHTVETEDTKLCVLDFEIIKRDPDTDQNHFGMHINIDNVDGPNNFIRYFYEDFNKLPKTCRCRMNGIRCIHM